MGFIIAIGNTIASQSGMSNIALPAGVNLNPDGTPYIQPDGTYEQDPT